MMVPTASVFAALVVAYLASNLITPSIVRVAVTRKLFDFPDRDRRGHQTPVPRLGGVAVFIGLAAALLSVKLLFALANHRAPELPQLTLAVGAGCVILFLIGLTDDVRGVPPLAKLAGQTAAAILVCSAGFRIETVTLPPSITFSLGWAATPVTVIWLVGMSNAVNLVDGLDGLAGGIAMIALGTTATAAVVLGNGDVLWQSFALAGAVLGFLRHNWSPAKVFLGDCGSLVLGFLLATLSVRGATRQDGVLFGLAPIFALSYPLLDTGIAMLRRWLRGVPLSRADGRHIHHQLRSLALSPRRAVLTILVQSLTIAILGLCVTFAPPRVTVAVSAMGGAILFFVFAYGLRWLQYHEFLEVGASFTSAVLRARSVIRDKIVARDLENLIGRATNLAEVDQILNESRSAFNYEFIGITRAGEELISGESFADPRLLKLEYPILPLYDGTVKHPSGLLTLSIVCVTDSAKRAASPERVARIVAPSIARWALSDEAKRLTEVRSRFQLRVETRPLVLETPLTSASQRRHSH